MKNQMDQIGGWLKVKGFFAGLWMLLIVTAPIKAEERHSLPGHIPAAVRSLNLQPAARLPTATVLSLQIGLALRNAEGFTNQWKQLYHPGDPKYHHWLTPLQIAQNYGPTEEDYQAVIDLAQANGLTVTGRQFDHTLLGVSGTCADIEKMFHVKMLVYHHPTENRTFYAPDAEPSVALSVPLWHVSGLDDFFISHPAPFEKDPVAIFPTNRFHTNNTPKPIPQDTGSGPGGSYLGNDFRNLYAFGVTNTGSGQRVGIQSQQDYLTSDIQAYEAAANLPNVPITKVIVDELDLYNTNGAVNSGESSLDIEMVISMAPGLSEVLVYEGHNSNQVNVLKRMQTDDLANQLTSSYTLYDPNDNPIFMMMAMQGQSFFLASGDSGAYPPGSGSFNDNPNVTIVGGTSPFTSSPGGAWTSEVAWQNSGGGVSATYPIPSYQQGVSMALNGGSYTMRNIPDVSMIAQTIIFSIYGGGITRDYVGGTSAATPLWAAFTALINQQAADNGYPPAGFLNPLIYEIGQGANYPSYFHDITMGNNTWSNSPNAYYATDGYDLVTGWGTPIGSNLIYLLAQTSNSVWVDFSYSSSLPQLGTFSNPYSTLAQGVTAVATGGNIYLKPGSSTETISISKPMTIKAYSGPVTVGK